MSAALEVPVLDVPLPRDWPLRARSALLHAIALAHLGVTHVRSWCVNSRIARVRLVAENERLKSEVAMLGQELRIKDARLARIAARERPHYPPPARLAILALRAARGWTVAETARRFLLTAATVASWMQRLDEQGKDALVRFAEPVNKLPDFVRALVHTLRATLPTMGKVRVAQLLARAGLHLAPTTVARLGNEPRGEAPPPPGDSSSAEPRAADRPPPRTVTARYPHHLWHVDLTIMPTSSFWVPWIPFSFWQRWPFAWWIGVVVDHFSRAVVAEAVFDKQPTAADVCGMLDVAVANAGRAPRHIISDQGCQFRKQYRTWCRRSAVRPRFGALGKHGSIAVVERFFRTLKQEALRRILVPLSHAGMQAELGAYTSWYNEHRPHQSLGGATPKECLEAIAAVRERARFETRPRLPIRERPGPGRGAPRRCAALRLLVSYHDGRKHLPIVELRQAA